MKIVDILNNVDNGSLALPVFQRGYVWKRPQVKDLMNSLYRNYPVGSLLMWRTRAEQADVRTNGNALQAGPIDLLLDGQQRVTSLYGVVRGSPPSFFDGDAKAFTDLYFNLESGDFDFFVSNRMLNNPLWVKVSSLFTSSQDWITNLTANQSSLPNLHTLLQKGMQVRNILDMDLPDESLILQRRVVW